MQSDCKMIIAFLQNKTGKQSDKYAFCFPVFFCLCYFIFCCTIKNFRTLEHFPIFRIKHTFGGYSQAWNNGQT